MEIIKKSTMDVWISALHTVIFSGDLFKDSNDRKCKEILGLRITIEEPNIDIDEPIKILQKSKNWIYPTLDEIKSIILTKKISPTYLYSYGSSLFNYKGVLNQIDDFIVPLLKKDPNSRKAVATLFDPILVHRQKQKNQQKLFPGLLLIDFKLRKGKLHLLAFIRSQDLFFGWPANIYQLFILQQYVQEKIGCEIGSLSTYSTSAHIFEDELKGAEEILGVHTVV